MAAAKTVFKHYEVNRHFQDALCGLTMEGTQINVGDRGYICFRKDCENHSVHGDRR